MTICHVTGNFYEPSGGLSGAKSFVMRRAPTEVAAEWLGVVLPDDLHVKIDKQGRVDFTALTGNYIGMYQAQNSGMVTFRVVVPDAATALFSDCVSAGTPVLPNPAWLDQAFEARDDALDAASEANASAGLSAQSALDAQTAAANAQASAMTVASWTALSALTSSVAGTGAEVLDTDTGTHTDPVVGGTVANAGRYSWSASPAGWRRIGDTGLAAKVAYGDAVAANIWPDPFHEEARWRPYRNTQYQYYFGTLNTDTVTSPYARPYLSFASGGNAQSTRLLTDLEVLPGDVVSLRVHGYFATGAGQATIYFRDSALAVISSFVQTKTSVDTGEQQFSFSGLSVPEGTASIEVRLSQGSGGRLYTVALSKGKLLPAYGYSAATGARRDRMMTQKNLWPDPFFRQLAAGLTHHQGWTYGQIEGLSYPLITTSANSPFPEQRVMRFVTGAGQLDMYVHVGHLGLRAGDKLTVALGVYSAQNLNLAVFGRTAAHAVVGATGNTAFTFGGATSRELQLTIDVDETFAKTVDLLNVRFGNSLTVGATPIEIWGRGLFVNATEPRLYDDAYAEDMRAIADFRRPTISANAMRECQQRSFAMLYGSASTLTIALIGDSYTHLRARYSGPLAESLQNGLGGNMALGYAGHGWIGFGNPSGTTTGQINGSVLSDVTVTVNGTIPASAYATAAGPDICSATLVSGGGQYRINNLPAGTDSLRLIGALGSGTLQYSTDMGATWTDLDMSVGTTIVSQLLTVPTALFHLWLRAKDGSAPVVLYGIDHRKGAKGCIVHKLGATGSTAAQWAAQAATAEWRAGLAALAPNAVFVMLAANDQTSSTRPNVFKGYIEAIVDGITAAVPAADICLMVQPENQRANNVKMAAYASVIRDVALRRNYAFHDLQQDYGRQEADYDWNGIRPWFAHETDSSGNTRPSVHPNSDPAVGGGLPIAARYRKIIVGVA